VVVVLVVVGVVHNRSLLSSCGGGGRGDGLFRARVMKFGHCWGGDRKKWP